MANELKTWLEFALQQMAAECYLEAIDPSVSEQLRAALIQGNNTLGFPISGHTRFTDRHAEYFVQNLEIVKHHASDATGFSATLMRNRVTGEYTLSFRSTEYRSQAQGGDWERDGLPGADGSAAATGFALGQLAAMENLYSSLSATIPFGTKINVTGYSLGGHLATVFTELHADDIKATYLFNAAGRGVMVGGTTPEGIRSMIGYFSLVLISPSAGRAPRDLTEQALYDLAVSAAQADPQWNPFAEGSSGSIYNDPRYAWAKYLTSQTYPTLPALPSIGLGDAADGLITQIYGKAASGDLQVVANSQVHANENAVFIEGQPLIEGFGLSVAGGDYGNTHAIILIVDSLALMDTLQRADPLLTQAQVEGIFQSASAQRAKLISPLSDAEAAEGDSLERILDAVHKILIGNADPTPFTRLPGGFGDIQNRNAFYIRLDELNAAIGTSSETGYRIYPLANIDYSTITSAASENTVAGLAYRYALRELNPFVLTTNTDAYSKHNRNGELDLYEAANRTGTLTAGWVTDRAKLLYAQLIRNAQDIFDPQVPVLLPEPGDVAFEYHHYRAGKEEAFFAQPANSIIGQLPTETVMFADDAGQLLVGTAQLLGDRLYGGAGTDYLQGRANDDSLEGGKGLDIYQYNASNSINDGADVLRDIDGKGVLRYTYTQSGFFSSTMRSTVIADASVRASGIAWNSADGKFSYIRSQNDLIVTINDDAGGRMTIKDFQDGDFNIHLWEARTEPQTAPPEIVGDLQPQDFDLNTDGIQTQTDTLGNVIVTTNPEPGRTDVLNDSSANDRIIAGGGNDILRGIRGGDDWMSGDAGRDNLAGGSGADLLESGADGIFGNELGGDIAFGDVGNDEIYADTKIALSTAINQGSTGAATNAKGEFLSGGGGEDWIIGAAGNDYLDGGSGQDLIIGGAGDDNLTGDYGFVATTPLWVITREIVPEGDLTVHRLNFVSGSVSGLDLGLGAADVIYAGSGADWVAAGDGDDFIDGGLGQNKIWGEAGSDVLIGSADDDLLVGDNPTVITGAAEGADYLDGGSGNDKLEGDGGGDVLIGGSGIDTLSGGTGKDIYVFNKGDGTETVFDDDTNPGNPDASVLVLGDGISPSTIKFKTGSLAIDLGPSDASDTTSPHDVIHLNGFNQIDPIASIPVAEIRFATGESMSYADILTRGFDIDGTDSDDTGVQNLVGTGVTDRIHGFKGNDLLFGLRGEDVLDGGDGVDQILAGPDADVIYGGSEHDEIWGDAESGGIFAPDGEDSIYGGAGNDVVEGNGGADQIFGEGDSDTLYGDDGADVIDGGAGDDFLYGQGYFFVLGVPSLNLFDDGASDVLSGGDGNDYLNAAGGNDTLYGGGGSDSIEGDLDADYLAGGDGDDFLWGDKADSPLTDQGDDTLDGGTGNDQLVGYAGNDTYVFGRGYGQDIVFDSDATSGNFDQVTFTEEITPDHVSAAQSGGSLVLALSGTTDTLTIANHFASAADRVEQIRFADGTVWAAGAIPLSIRGTAGNDVLNGTSGADVFEGMSGNDTMSGGIGNDTYRISPGDGQDVVTDSDSTSGNIDRVVYVVDILPSDIQVVRLGNNLVLRRTSTVDQVTVTNYFLNDGVTPSSVEQIKFLADGTVWDVSTVKEKALGGTSGADLITGYGTSDILNGLEGNDTLNGNAGHDTLDGGAGNDLLQGATGNDVYLITRGSGQDTITDTDATGGNIDRIVYAPDIAPSEVQVTRSSNNLVLKLTDTTDQVTVTGYFQNDGVNSSLVEQVEFPSDGTVWGVDTVKLLALTGGEGNDSIIGYATNDVLSGFGGNDTLIGNTGQDTLDGGTGNDLLQGGSGNDVYLIARGSGQDTLTDSDATIGNIDKIIYAADIPPFEVRATRSGDNLVLKIDGTNDQVMVTNYFQNDGATSSLVEQIAFLTDGITWNLDFIKSAVLAPTDSDDAITGYASDDSLSGLGGNDLVHGAAGNDTLNGGTGNDTLSGDGGADTYLFAPGDGQDVIDNAASDGGGTTDALVFASDILPDDITLTRELRDLVLRIQDTTDQVRIQNYFFSGTNVIEEIHFADGTVWNEQTILTFLPPPPIVGTEGTDILQGTTASELIQGLAGDDTLRGGGGNDTFEGGAGEDWKFGLSDNDTYLFNLGDGGPAGFFEGGDVLSDSGGYDVLQFGAGISPAGGPDITEFNDPGLGHYIHVDAEGTPGGVYILNYFSSGHIEEIRFTNGTVWTDQTIAALVPIYGTSGIDSLSGTIIADVMFGFEGNDLIHGNSGRDTLDGGLGSDTLFGEAGDDALIAGTGEAKNAKLSNFLYGGAGDDILRASGKTDQLYGESGNDILLGDLGNDRLEDGEGKNLAFGGGGADQIYIGDESDFVIAGPGNDLIDGDSDADGIGGRDVLAFNKSDGSDSAFRLGSGSTISIGGALYSNLSLEVQGNTLRLKTASSHYIALNDWYSSSDNRSVSTLQIVIEGTRDYKPTSTNTLNNKRVQVFDFLGLVDAFDAAQAAGRRFSVASALADAHIWGSDTEAIGGAIAYQYARTGTISDLTKDQMQAVINDAAFGVSAQPIAVITSMAALTGEAATISEPASTDAFILARHAPVSQNEADIASADVVTDSDENIGLSSTTLDVDINNGIEGDSPRVSDSSALPEVPPENVPLLPQRALSQIASEIQTPPGLDLSSFKLGLPGVSAMKRARAVENPTLESTTARVPPDPLEVLPDDPRAPAAVSISEEAPTNNAYGWTANRAVAKQPDKGAAIYWLDRNGWNDDLTLLDDITRDPTVEDGTNIRGAVAAAWRRSHLWLNSRLNAAGGEDEPPTNGYLGATSVFGETARYLDTPRPAVGLRNVSGHDLEPFTGLREGVSVLAQ